MRKTGGTSTNGKRALNIKRNVNGNPKEASETCKYTSAPASAQFERKYAFKPFSTVARARCLSENN